jgi:methionine-rich copper-binding protein CopC
MIRKHFRIKRLVLGLAAAAIFAPAAQAHTYLPQDRSQVQPTTQQQSKVITPLQADGMRWTAMAKFYNDRQPGITAAGTAIANQKHNAYSVPVAATSASGSDGFSWSDAGIGASAVFAGLLVLLTIVGLGRRNRTRGLANA